MKMTEIKMDWTDDGADVLSTIPISCPRCGVMATPGVRHLCGDRIPKVPSRTRKKRAIEREDAKCGNS